ncbi:hypothetical protein BD289DRAFT_261016 [Coniella lustricola]|uniref:Uncharacterized protein n=1 Tax=Coniella lustricola TaxID=2025994 RepID=A0A2T3A7T4_9PEZI|nr:hypothetical protein BD289DRAFT_261016 [Coniella lustricola]
MFLVWITGRALVLLHTDCVVKILEEAVAVLVVRAAAAAAAAAARVGRLQRKEDDGLEVAGIDRKELLHPKLKLKLKVRWE